MFLQIEAFFKKFSQFKKKKNAIVKITIDSVFRVHSATFTGHDAPRAVLVKNLPHTAFYSCSSAPIPENAPLKKD